MVATFFLAYKVIVEKPGDSLMGLHVTICFPLVALKILLCIIICFYLAAFKILSLIFNIFIIIYIGLNLLGFIFFGALRASRTRMSLSFPRLGKFPAIIFSNKFSGPLSLFSFWEEIL